ncbi:MAG TPA: exodeoxyribonuclease VII large subunit [Candidatus Omnitrophota bacterium]|nr:exodeoxyribonuclease VII large subunit [Candidatus Omnitrophota bacterium]HOX09273.1 exodeoxyribonuclease VII large subunit [Candidatus Omnitrophota bacterium]HPN65897.1 exodeoxyribonuclease VII large subunit [Candidatus Omnitrophota bacterium]HRZ67425.1 exodeoxyribonuclease VII large subunit [Candidatus Omnitrophota bacterium]
MRRQDGKGNRDKAHTGETPITDAGRLIYSVTQITREIKAVLDGAFPQVWVEGEVSNFKLHSSGHMYFALKDAESVIQCAFFRESNQSVKFQMKDGIKVLCLGRVGYYNKTGQTQLYIDRAEPKGIGELQLAFEQLKEKLQKEGLFDEAHKVPVPMLPSRIAVVTSPTGAVIRDILHILRRRFSDVEILIYPVRVQGDGASAEIAGAIGDLNRMKDIDVMIIARGGGSLEDLWAFNEEEVARAIYASRIPVISAVGHEVDYTIADFTADLRAPTPSAAAELVIARKEELVERVEGLVKGLRASLEGAVALYESRLAGLTGSPAFRYPLEKVERYAQELDDLERARDSHFSHGIEIKSRALDALIGKMDALSPLAILKRGYSITLSAKEGAVLKDVKGLKRGDIIETKLSGGKLVSEIKDIIKEGPR